MCSAYFSLFVFFFTNCSNGIGFFCFLTLDNKYYQENGSLVQFYVLVNEIVLWFHFIYSGTDRVSISCCCWKTILSLHRDVEIKHIVIKIFMIFNWQSVWVYSVLTVKRVKGTQSLIKWFPKRSHGMFKIVNSTDFSSISWELEQFHVQSNYIQLHSKFMTKWNGFTEEKNGTSHSFERHSNHIPCA